MHLHLYLYLFRTSGVIMELGGVGYGIGVARGSCGVGVLRAFLCYFWALSERTGAG